MVRKNQRWALVDAGELVGKLPPKRTSWMGLPVQVLRTLRKRNNAKLHCACMKRLGPEAAHRDHRIRKSGDVGKRKFPE
jgi:hypothetical protein